MTVEKLYKQHGEELEYAIVAFCQNKELAKDVKQQAFLKALMNRQNLENMPEQAAKAWLFATARNDIIDQMRKVKRLVLTGEIQWFEKEGTNEFTQFEDVKKVNVNCGKAIILNKNLGELESFDGGTINTGSLLASQEAYVSLLEKGFSINAGDTSILNITGKPMLV